MHVGLGLEFKQLKVVAEGFAQACVHHDYWYTEFLHKAEKDAAASKERALSLSDCFEYVSNVSLRSLSMWLSYFRKCYASQASKTPPRIQYNVRIEVCLIDARRFFNRRSIGATRLQQPMSS